MKVCCCDCAATVVEEQVGDGGLEPARAERPALRVVPSESSRERVEGMYRRYGPVIYRRCMRLLRNREEARDVTQEVFIKLIQELDRIGGGELSIRWVYRVTTNRCLNVLRESGRNNREPVDLHLDSWAASAGAGHDEIQLARTVLSRFDTVTQAVAVAVFIHGMEYDEVADLLGISRRTICRKVDRFLVNARKFLARSSL